jgi:hypothetical protein
MSENSQYLTALEIAKTLSEICDSKADAKHILDLASKLVELRWLISQSGS